MTFLEIFQDVARRTDKNAAAPDPETKLRLQTFINDRYRELMRLPGVMNMRDETFNVGTNYTFQSVLGQNTVQLPATIIAVTNLIDSTHRIDLVQRTMAWLREHDPSQPGTSTGTPTSYVLAPYAAGGWTLVLWPTPAGVYRYTVDGTKARTALVADGDVPALPEDFHTLLVWGGCEDELIHMDDNRSQAFAERWRKDVAALKGFLHHIRGERLIPNSRSAGWSPLGGNYPPWQ